MPTDSSPLIPLSSPSGWITPLDGGVKGSLYVITPEPAAEIVGGLGRFHRNVSAILSCLGWRIHERITPGLRTAMSRYNNFDKDGPPPTAVLLHSHWGAHEARRLAERSRCPVLLVLHSLEGDRPRRPEFLGARFAESVVLEEFAVGLADVICVPSRYMLNRTATYYPAVKSELFCVGSGVESAFFTHRHGVTDERNQWVSVVGRLEPEKGLVEFLEELASHVLPSTKIKVALYGRARPLYASYRREVQRAIRALCLEDFVCFSHFVHSTAQLTRIYRCSLAVVIPSVYEPFGLVALEAMAAGGLVIARRVGGLVEFLDHGQTGLLYDNGDGLHAALQFAQNLDRQAPVREHAQRIARRWTWHRVGASIDRILMETLERGKHP